ncbi:serine protease [Catenulispora yoronensis]
MTSPSWAADLDLDADVDVKRAFVSVHGLTGSEACGGGVLVDDNVVVTCAHVVTSALGHEVTGDLTDEQRSVELSFPFSENGGRVRAKVLGWFPRRGNQDGSALGAGRRTWYGDVAILKITGPPPPGIRPVRLEDHRLGSTVFSWYGSGEATTPVVADVQTLAGPWLVLDTASSARNFTNGFSGAPIWDRAQRAVVGIVVSVEPNLPRGFAISTREILRWIAGNMPLNRAAGHVVAGSASLEAFREALDAVLSASAPHAGLRSRQERAQHLVRRMRHTRRPFAEFDDDEVDALVVLALRLHRGMATLAAEAAAITRDPRLRQVLAAEALAVRPGSSSPTANTPTWPDGCWPRPPPRRSDPPRTARSRGCTACRRRTADCCRRSRRWRS